VLIANGNKPTHQVELRDVVIAGWTGRDKGAIEIHIRELENVGVNRTKGNTAVLLCIREPDHHERFGAGRWHWLKRRGQVVLLNVPGSVGLDLDQLIRNATLRLSVAVANFVRSRSLSKRESCRKPAITQDQLRLRSYSTRDGRRRLYQEGAAGGALPRHRY